jgi:hypothetical protein
VGGKPFKESESHSVMSRRSHRLSLSTRYARHRHLLRLQPPRFNELHRPSPPSHIGGSIVVESTTNLKETRHRLPSCVGVTLGEAGPQRLTGLPGMCGYFNRCLATVNGPTPGERIPDRRT